MRKLYLDIFEGIGHPQLLELVKQGGFDGFFSDWTFADDLPRMTALTRQGEALGLDFGCCHSTIPGTDTLWSVTPRAEETMAQLRRNLDNCAALGVDMMVVHVSPTDDPDFHRGIRRMEQVVDYAAARNITVAFENTHDEAYVVNTIRHFEGCANVGFCYDSGHEAFVTPGAHILPQVGHRLICTHLNDNWLDGDHHLIPGDGSIDFPRVIRELKDTGYAGPLTMELNYNRYRDTLTPEEFMKRCYDTAYRIAEFLDA